MSAVSAAKALDSARGRVDRLGKCHFVSVTVSDTKFFEIDVNHKIYFVFFGAPSGVVRRAIVEKFGIDLNWPDEVSAVGDLFDLKLENGFVGQCEFEKANDSACIRLPTHTSEAAIERFLDVKTHNTLEDLWRLLELPRIAMENKTRV